MGEQTSMCCLPTYVNRKNRQKDLSKWKKTLMCCLQAAEMKKKSSICCRQV